jgi:integrase
MPLTDTRLRAFKPADKAYKKTDTGGLYVLVSPNGSKLWRLNYRFGGLRKTAAFGIYPDVSLVEARDARDNAKRILRQGLDPGAAAKEKKTVEKQTAATFKVVAADWLQRKMIAEGKAATTITRARWLLKLLNGAVGSRPIGEIEAPELLTLLRRVEAQGKHEAVTKLRSTAGAVFRFGIATGVAKRDPAADLRGALTSVKATPHPAIIDAVEVGKLLRAIDAIEKPSVRLPLQLLVLVFTRPGEICRAEWSEFDFDAGVWSIPASKMKMRSDFRIPLSKQALAILKQLRAGAGKSKYLFPADSRGDRPMRTYRLNSPLRMIGYKPDEVTAHGFRSTASSILNESGKFSIDAIELSLAHAPRGVRGIYNRSQYWSERVELAQWYADHLDELRSRGEIVKLPVKKSPRRKSGA